MFDKKELLTGKWYFKCVHKNRHEMQVIPLEQCAGIHKYVAIVTDLQVSKYVNILSARDLGDSVELIVPGSTYVIRKEPKNVRKISSANFRDANDNIKKYTSDIASEIAEGTEYQICGFVDGEAIVTSLVRRTWVDENGSVNAETVTGSHYLLA